MRAEVKLRQAEFVITKAQVPAALAEAFEASYLRAQPSPGYETWATETNASDGKR